MGSEEVKIKVSTVVSDEELEALNKQLTDLEGKTSEVQVKANDEASDELDNVQKKSDGLDGLAPVIKPTVDNSEATASLQGLENQVSNLDGLGGAIAGGLGAIGLQQMLDGGIETATNMDKAWRSWVGSLQHSGLALDDAKKKANDLYKTVNRLSSEGQSNDTFFKNIANVLISSNNNISDSTLDMTEKVVAGYELMRSKSGDTLFEMEKEIQQYLSSGDTTRLTELQSIGGGKWMPLLEEAKTPEERIKVLHDLLEEEGIMGALNIDAPSKSLDQLKALFEAGMSDIGNIVINAIKPVADAFLWLDNVTGGVSTTVLVVGGIIALLGVTLIGVASLVMTTVVPGFIALVAGMFGVSAGSLTLTGAVGLLTGGFMGLATAVWAALAPLLPFIAIALAVAGAIYLIGLHLGWWKDIPSMFESIKDGITRLWSAFVNNKHVQAVIQWLKDAWQSVSDFLKPIFTAITNWWNSMFPGGNEGFDVVRMIIDYFGIMGNIISQIIGVIIIPYLQMLWIVWGTVFNAIITVLRTYWTIYSTIFRAVVVLIGFVVTAFNNFKSKVMGVISAVIGHFNNFKAGVSAAVNSIKGFLDGLYQKYVWLKNSVMSVLQPIIDTMNTIQSGLGSISFGSPYEMTYNNSPAAGSPFEEAVNNDSVTLPNQGTTVVNNFNSLVTERDVTNYIMNIVNNATELDKLRGG